MKTYSRPVFVLAKQFSEADYREGGTLYVTSMLDQDRSGKMFNVFFLHNDVTNESWRINPGDWLVYDKMNVRNCMVVRKDEFEGIYTEVPDAR